MGVVSVVLVRGELPDTLEEISGSGSGDGSGYGSGSGSGVQWKQVACDALHGITVDAESFIAFWKSDKNGKPCNGGNGTVAKVGLRESIQGPLRICTKRGLHATMKPDKWQGERLWLVALHGDIQREDDKAAALEREFLCEVKI